jgi:hypothetical protein
MNPPVYSSLEAFLAHYDALSAAAARRADAASTLGSHERDLLVVMDQTLDALDPGDRAAIAAVTSPPPPAAGAVACRRARAERSLRRVLAARGILQG